MMAPYAIAHMKIGLKLAETGYRFGTEERARIYLTNALEPQVHATPADRLRRRSPTKPPPSTKSNGISASPSSSAIRRIPISAN